jgi:hypothetical protein
MKGTGKHVIAMAAALAICGPAYADSNGHGDDNGQGGNVAVSCRARRRSSRR